jgi:long-chain acyl-CoA synthetase
MSAYAELMRTVYGVTKGCRVLIGGPLYHASPNACLRQAIAQAELILVQTKFDAERTRDGSDHVHTAGEAAGAGSPPI